MTNTYTTAEIADLIDKHRHKSLTNEERERLQRWVDEHADNRTFFGSIVLPGTIGRMAAEMLDVDIKVIRDKLEEGLRK